jgi:hypothetical protein
VRDDLLLPDEARHFAGRRALALLLSQDDGIAELLGDAENPAHRGWNASSEHVRERWRNPAAAIGRIRQILPRLYDLLTRERLKDETVLARFFPKRQTKGDGPSPPPPPPDGEGREFSIVSERRDGRVGFRVASKRAQPGSYRVQVWLLDVDRRRRYDPPDFDLADAGQFAVAATGCRIEGQSGNVIEFAVDEEGPVRIVVLGCDPRRDLHVDISPAGAEGGSETA